MQGSCCSSTIGVCSVNSCFVLQGIKTPLFAASLMGHLDIVKDLLKAKASVTFTSTGRVCH